MKNQVVKQKSSLAGNNKREQSAYVQVVLAYLVLAAMLFIFVLGKDIWC